jgi:hypothetical protein
MGRREGKPCAAARELNAACFRAPRRPVLLTSVMNVWRGVLFGVVCALLLPAGAGATDLPVTTAADSGAGSLRQLVADATAKAKR